MANRRSRCNGTGECKNYLPDLCPRVLEHQHCYGRQKGLIPEPKLIETWEELAKCESPTHAIEMEDCAAWTKPLTERKDDDYYEHHIYLSTHTFYGKTYQYSTEVLQRLNFNVVIDNWDR